MRRAISTAVVVLVTGLSLPGLASVAHAAVPSQAVTASCSITAPSGNCYAAGEFCSRADLGESTTAANGEAIRCAQDGQYHRWLGTDDAPAMPPASMPPDTPGGGSATGSGPGATGTGMPPRVAPPLGGVAAGGGGLALTADSQDATSTHGFGGLPVDLAAGALAAGIGGVLVVRRRRAADRR